MFLITQCQRMKEMAIWRGSRRGRKTRDFGRREQKIPLSKMKTPFSDSWRVNFLSQFFFILSFCRTFALLFLFSANWGSDEWKKFRALYLRLFSKLGFLFFSVYICEVVQNGFESLFRSFSYIVISLVANSGLYRIGGGVAFFPYCFDFWGFIFSHLVTGRDRLRV